MLDSSTGSLKFYSNGTEVGGLYKSPDWFGARETLMVQHNLVNVHGLNGVQIYSTAGIYVGSNVSTTYFDGTVDFTNAKVQGLTATFA